MLIPVNMHDRVHRAYLKHEYAMRWFYLDVRWMFVVSGLEGLIANSAVAGGGRGDTREPPG